MGINNCYNNGIIEYDGTLEVLIGGLVGEIWTNVNNSYNSGMIVAPYGIAGGLVGSIRYWDEYISITNSYNSGSLHGDNLFGIAGTIYEGVTLESIYNNGKLVGTGAGISNTNSGTINGCYNVGEIISTATGGDSGLVGTNSGTIVSCYNIRESDSTSASNNVGVGTNTGTINYVYSLSK